MARVIEYVTNTECNLRTNAIHDSIKDIKKDIDYITQKIDKMWVIMILLAVLAGVNILSVIGGIP